LTGARHISPTEPRHLTAQATGHVILREISRKPLPLQLLAEADDVVVPIAISLRARHIATLAARQARMA
jgi:hypothetical protein